MIRRWIALTYYLYALRLAALSHFYFNPLYKAACTSKFRKCRLLFGFVQPMARLRQSAPSPEGEGWGEGFGDARRTRVQAAF